MNDHLALLTGLAGKPSTQRFSFSVRIFGGLAGPHPLWDLSTALGTGRLDQDAHTHTLRFFDAWKWMPGSRGTIRPLLYVCSRTIGVFFRRACRLTCTRAGDCSPRWMGWDTWVLYDFTLKGGLLGSGCGEGCRGSIGPVLFSESHLWLRDAAREDGWGRGWITCSFFFVC
jgi:hypothetical protein